MLRIGTNQTLDQLGIRSRDQLDKLVATNMLTDVRTPGARNRKFDAAEVTALATTPTFQLPSPTALVLALHLGHLRPWENPGRDWMGVDVKNTRGLPGKDRELAWVGYWGVSDMTAVAMVGNIIVGDIAGWIPQKLARRVTGWNRVNGGVMFEVEKLKKTESAIYTDKRFIAKPGAPFQML